jgi:hypothetical protein
LRAIPRCTSPPQLTRQNWFAHSSAPAQTSKRGIASERGIASDQLLHAAAVGSPGSPWWNPQAQAETILCLIEAGADPNTADKRGVTPLHKAVRTRCASAVRALLERGADPARKNKSGSTAMVLATHNTGRGGTGSPEAREQQGEIVRLLEERSS